MDLQVSPYLSEPLRLSKLESSVSWLRVLLAMSLILNFVIPVALLFFGGINVFTRSIRARDILLQDDKGKTAGELGVRNDWDESFIGKFNPQLRFYDNSRKPMMVTSITGSSFTYGEDVASMSFTGFSAYKKQRHISINPDLFSFANDSSVLMISPTKTGFDFNASANGNSFGLLVSDKYASMFVSDPKSEVDVTAEDGKPQINRILTNRSYVQPVQ